MTSAFAGCEMARLFSTVRPQITKGILNHLMGFVGEKLQPPFPLFVDIGCGTGQSTSLFAPYFNSVVGIDIAEDMITLANKLNKEKNVSFRVGSGINLPFEEGSATLITCIQSAHWMPLKALFDQCDRLLRSNGVLAVVGYRLPELSYRNEPEIDLRLNRVIKEMNNALHAQGCWTATRYLVDTEFADVSMPYRTCKRLSSRDHEELCMRKTMLIEDFIALLKSWSAMKVYENRKGGRDDFLSAIRDQLMAPIPNSNTRTPIEVIFPWFIVMSRKED